MKIDRLTVSVACPGRNFVTLRIDTDEGVSGLGDATLNGREHAVRAYLEDHLAPCLVGKDATRIEDTWQYLYRGAYWRRGPVTMAAIAAVDQALWDINARAMGVPLYRLLGGKSRESVRTYAHTAGADIAQTKDHVAAAREHGYDAIRVQCGVPGVKSVYGVGRGTYFYEPEDRRLPPEHAWNTRKYMNFAPKLFEELRAAVGPDVDLLHDVHHRLTPREAAELGKRLEPYDLFFMEDPTPAENQQCLRLIRQHTTTPIAIGEVFNSIFDCQTLITEQLIDFIRMTVTHGGGITHLRKVAALAEIYQVRTAFHGPTDVSPVGMAACLHLSTALHNFGIQELMHHSEQVREIFSAEWTLGGGHVRLPDKPGLGVEYDDQAAEKHPYERFYLPVNRLEDGSMWNW